MATQTNNYSYNKIPFWQWVILYIVIGAIAYGLIYYFILGKKSGTYNQPQPATTVTSESKQVPSDNIYMTRASEAKGSYLADFQGMTLYTFDKDTPGTSNCYNGCAKAWPPYTSGATTQSQFPVNITVITRTDGSKQFAWKGMPLYYYATDAKAGDITGDGVNGVWHIIKP